jgi:hypothetical protein
MRTLPIVPTAWLLALAAFALPFARSSGLDVSYLLSPAYAGRSKAAVALAGFHGGGRVFKGFSVAAHFKPDAAMAGGDTGDIVGFGARRVVLRLEGGKAPYKLVARIDCGETIATAAVVTADGWHHAAATGEPTPDGKWKVRVFLDGKQAAEGVSGKLPVPAVMPESLILGTEIFYFKGSHYRGLIGRTMVFDRPLPPGEIAALATKESAAGR